MIKYSTYNLYIYNFTTHVIMSISIKNLLLHERSGLAVALTEKDFNNVLTMKSRTNLLNWLFKISEKLDLDPLVFFQTISMIDVCIKHLGMLPKDLRLIGVSCLIISSKKYDIDNVCARDIVKQCQHEFTRGDINAKELEIMKFIGFNVEFSNVLVFILFISCTIDDA